MATQGRHEASRHDVRLADSTRVEFFSDGVFAIVITLLAVEIHRPEVPAGQLAPALLHGWASYVAYALGFVYVGVIWLNHHALFRLVERVDPALTWINLGVLGTTALMPFATGVLASSFQEGTRADQRAAVVLYAIVAGLMSAAWLPVFPHLRRRPELAAPHASPDIFAAQYGRPVTGVALFALAGVAGWFVHPLTAIVVFVLMAAYHARTSEDAQRAAERLATRVVGEGQGSHSRSA